MTENGSSLKSFLAAAPKLLCLVDCERHVGVVKDDSFTTWVCSGGGGGGGFVRVKALAVRRARGNALLNMVITMEL